MTGLDGRGDQVLRALGPRAVEGPPLISAKFENFFFPKGGGGSND